MKKQEFVTLCGYIQKTYGINLEKKQVLMECRLSQVLENYHMTNFQEYIDLVLSDKDGKYVDELLNQITTNYSFFMREPDHFSYLTDHVLPDIAPGRQEPLRIWCAGCASGQECYSLAMVLDEYHSLKKELPPFYIIGTDISTKALDQAKSGKYPLKELEQIPETWRTRYCKIDSQGESFEMKDSLKQNIRFQKQNLMEVRFYRKEFELIFCRNVMIYFGEQIRKKVISKFFDALNDNGYLFIGHTEVIPYDSPFFSLLNSSIYRKKD